MKDHPARYRGVFSVGVPPFCDKGPGMSSTVARDFTVKTTHYLKLGSAPFVLGIGLLASASPAMAQDAQTGDTATTSDEIIVTGTRIPQANLESAAPITVVSAEDIKLQGSTRVEDMLNRSEEHRGGQEWVRTCRSRWPPYH